MLDPELIHDAGAEIAKAWAANILADIDDVSQEILEDIAAVNGLIPMEPPKSRDADFEGPDEDYERLALFETLCKNAAMLMLAQTLIEKVLSVGGGEQ